jgi:hypothetical protein
MTRDDARQAQLLAQGWRRQFMANEPRLGEAVAQYLEMGFEVRLEAVDPQICRRSGGCASCYEQPGVAEQFKIIYTRKPAAPDDPST